MKKEGVKASNARGKRKLSKDALAAFPQEIIKAFVRLPKIFKRLDMDRHLKVKISRSMKWRYLRRMEALGLIKHSTKKYYQKIYDTISDWMEKEAIPKVRRAEVKAKLEQENR
jgi:hypothetical protein